MYRIQLQQFEGPLDLLLFFIQRDELDVYDIPIARIADEFLEYVKLLERVDLDGVGDFVYMAALLINIKARMLLPSPELDEEGEEIDPRRELVERLLEYMRFKEASHRLDGAHEARAQLFTRGAAGRPPEADDAGPVELADASVFDLISALRRVLTEAPEGDEPVHGVVREHYTVEEQTEFVLDALLPGRRTAFRELVRGRSKPFVITTFLAVLELTRDGYVTVWVDEQMTTFALEPRPAVLGGDGEPEPPAALPAAEPVTCAVERRDPDLTQADPD